MLSLFALQTQPPADWRRRQPAVGHDGMVSFLSEASSVQGSETHNKANCKAFQLVKLPREGQQA